MANTLLTRIFGSHNERQMKKYRKIANRIQELESTIAALSDEQLQAKTVEFKQKIAKSTLEDLLPEAFAVVREAAKRVMGQRHFDVQLMGAMALHGGKIAEMGTGEGKTLTATLAVYLNALSGKGVHVVTVNDYLAARDAKTMSTLYNFLGLTVGVNLPDLDKHAKQSAYNADITYGTNNEFGFDYLRDNMVYDIEDRVQRGLHFAIVDEVDSILIDEARTPLIISGQADDHTAIYSSMNTVPALLVRQIGEADPVTGEGVTTPGDFTLDEKTQQVFLTESGYEKAEEILAKLALIPAGSSLYESSNILLVHHLYSALRAHCIYNKDQHYVVQDGEVVIVDEFTGRLMSGRRWSEGLHQAVEAKEGVEIKPENQTMASITFQNYFRLYTKLSGMTGTADTEAYEFQSIYGLETLIIPPNRPSKRIDYLDRVYKTTQEKYTAAVADIRDCYERGQPVLVGTTSIENSEILDVLLNNAQLPHQVLNAKQHAREADIIAQAGRPKMITIATNMAGRGTDIVLGGNLHMAIEAIQQRIDLDTAAQATAIAQTQKQWKIDHDFVKSVGGLRIIATERHESRRIDNQLRGRSGRQGDNGSSRFFLSLDDSLMRIFAGERVKAIMERLKMPEGEAIEAKMVTRSIESAQRKVEGHNFDMRKQVLQYDDVANEQRKVIYQQRTEILLATDLSAQIQSLRHGCLTDVVRQFVPHETVEEQWNLKRLEKELHNDWHLDVPLRATVEAASSIEDSDIVTQVLQAADAAFDAKIQIAQDPDAFVHFQRMVLLQNLDTHWREHLSALDHLRQGIHLRSYAQQQPQQEYKKEAFHLFEQLLDAVKHEVTKVLMQLKIEPANDGISPAVATHATSQLTTESVSNDVQSIHKKLTAGRNDPCPCGSGQRYKLCHGKLT